MRIELSVRGTHAFVTIDHDQTMEYIVTMDDIIENRQIVVLESVAQPAKPKKKKVVEPAPDSDE